MTGAAPLEPSGSDRAGAQERTGIDAFPEVAPPAQAPQNGTSTGNAPEPQMAPTTAEAAAEQQSLAAAAADHQRRPAHAAQVAEVQPQAVPISSARLSEILSYYGMKLSVAGEGGAEDVGFGKEGAVGACGDPSVAAAATTCSPPRRGSTATDPAMLELDAVPMATVVGRDAAAAMEAEMQGSGAPPRRFRRLRLWWRRNGKQTMRIVAIVLLGASAIAFMVVSPVGGVFLLANLAFVVGAGAATVAAGAAAAAAADDQGSTLLQPVDEEVMFTEIPPPDMMQDQAQPEERGYEQ